MKRTTFALVLIFFNLVSVFANFDLELVNEQEIDLERINTIKIHYRSDNITLYSHSSNKLIIKEYMNRNNSRYYAKIDNSGNEVVVKTGNRPWGLFNIFFRTDIVVFIPVSNKSISISTSNGKIEANGEYTFSSLNINSSNGNLSVNAITAENISLKTSNGSIRCKSLNGNTTVNSSNGSTDISNINGNVLAKTSNGRINLGIVNGEINITTSNGNVFCTVTENTGNVSISTSNGSVNLDITRDLEFNFSSRSSNGSLKTPFSDKLSIPLSDKNLIQGIIGNNNSGNQILRNINIKTSNGSRVINWI